MMKFRKEKKQGRTTDASWWYNFHEQDSRYAHFGLYANMFCMGLCAKYLVSNVSGFLDLIWWIFLLVMNGLGIYWGRININAIEERKLDLVMENI